MHLLIVEDELRIAQRIQRMSKDFFDRQITTLAHRDSVEEGKEYLEQHQVDLLLLDLNLNGVDGFEILQEFAAGAFHVIIISAYHDQALRAFEFGVLDFVPKPFSRDRLNRAFERLGSRKADGASGLAYLAVQKKGMLQLLRVEELRYIQGAGVYTEMVMVDGRREIHNKSLDKLGQLLPESFQRVHKSYIVDLRRIQDIRVASGGKYTALLDNGEEIPIGRSRYAALREKLL